MDDTRQRTDHRDAARTPGPPARPPRLEPRLVFVAVVVLGIALVMFLQTFVMRSGNDCDTQPDVGGFGQMVMPGVSCE